MSVFRGFLMDASIISLSCVSVNLSSGLTFLSCVFQLRMPVGGVAQTCALDVRSYHPARSSENLVKLALRSLMQAAFVRDCLFTPSRPRCGFCMLDERDRAVARPCLRACAVNLSWNWMASEVLSFQSIFLHERVHAGLFLFAINICFY